MPSNLMRIFSVRFEFVNSTSENRSSSFRVYTNSHECSILVVLINLPMGCVCFRSPTLPVTLSAKVHYPSFDIPLSLKQLIECWNGVMAGASHREFVLALCTFHHANSSQRAYR